jgi:hypothetical protein
MLLVDADRSSATLAASRILPMSAKQRRKAKNGQIQAILLAVAKDKRERCLASFSEAMDRLVAKQAEEQEIAEVIGRTAIEIQKMVVEKAPKARITVEDCVHFLFDSMMST